MLSGRVSIRERVSVGGGSTKEQGECIWIAWEAKLGRERKGSKGSEKGFPRASGWNVG